MVDYGVTSETDVADNLVAGDLKKRPVPVDAGVGTASRGQVLQWDSDGDNWVAYTAGSAGIYVVLAEDIVITVDTVAEAYVTGSDLNLSSMDQTAQDDAEIIPALLSSGIIARTSVTVE